jgi:NADPH:quinone reductase-like Zn-dependent oxidoreductase
MKAAQINSYGDVSVVVINPNASEPVAKTGQVIVAVRAASFNPFDATLRKGVMKDRMPFPFPITVGGDFAGTVSETGEGATGFSVGDEVYGSANIANGGSGSFAEFAVANAANTALKPAKADFNQAAALPLVGTSAVQALEEHMKLQRGQKILIHGGAGGIGHIAIQLAKYLGAYVATTVRTNNVDFVKSLGADEVVDFTKEDFSVKLKDFDAVYDVVGGEVLTKSQAVLRPGGIIVSMKGQPEGGIGQATKTNTAHLTRLAQLVDMGAVHVHIDKVFPLENVQEAWKHQEESHPQGKVVLTIS